MYNMYVRRYFGGWYLFRFFLFLFILKFEREKGNEILTKKREREFLLFGGGVRWGMTSGDEGSSKQANNTAAAATTS